jgi:hypothetical protein
MSQESVRTAYPAVERRPAVWPWVLMPLAALAMFVLLRSVRQTTVSGPTPGASAAAPDDSGAPDGL